MRVRQWLLPLIGCSVVIMSLYGLRTRQAASAATVILPQRTPFVLTATGQTWNDKPVYCLENRTSGALNNFVIQSWSGEILPLLAIGTPPNMTNQLRPLGDPPYTLPPHAKVWLIGPNAPPIQMTLLWLTNGQAEYANLKTSSNGQ